MTHVATALRMNTDYCIVRALPIQLLSGTLSRALPRKDPPTFCESFRDLTANHRGRPYTTHRGLKMQAALVEDGYGKKNSGTLDSSNHLSHAIECPVSCKCACYKKLEAVTSGSPAPASKPQLSQELARSNTQTYSHVCAQRAQAPNLTQNAHSWVPHPVCHECLLRPS